MIGSEGLDEELKRVVRNQTELANALLELERFSVIKWHRVRQSISIHRLVQTVIHDEMPVNERERPTS